MIGTEKIKDIFDEQSEDVIFWIRAHLLIEYFLDKIIRKFSSIDLGQNERFYTKILIVQALDVLPLDFIEAIKHVNKVRNKIAHRLEYKLSDGDKDELLAILDKRLKDGKIENVYWAALFFIFGFLDSFL